MWISAHATRICNGSKFIVPLIFKVVGAWRRVNFTPRLLCSRDEHLIKRWVTHKADLGIWEKGIISGLFVCSISLTVIFAIDILKSSRLLYGVDLYKVTDVAKQGTALVFTVSRSNKSFCTAYKRITYFQMEIWHHVTSQNEQTFSDSGVITQNPANTSYSFHYQCHTALQMIQIFVWEAASVSYISSCFMWASYTFQTLSPFSVALNYSKIPQCPKRYN